jgi:hypothetical protein
MEKGGFLEIPYCLTTSLSVDELDKESVHARYKDLAMLEETFRTCKTGQLDLRSISVRKQDRTRGHVFVVMLSYLLIQTLWEYWNTLDMTVEAGIEFLETLCTVEFQLDGNIPALYVPKPHKEIEQLLTFANIPIPKIIPSKIKSKLNTKSKTKN